MLRLMKRNPVMKTRLQTLMHKRFAENLYLTTGKVTVASAATAMLKIRRLVGLWRDRRRAAAEGKKPPGDDSDDEHAAAPAKAPAASTTKGVSLSLPKEKLPTGGDPMAA